MHRDDGVGRQLGIKAFIDKGHEDVRSDFFARLSLPARAQPERFAIAGRNFVAIAAEVIERAELARRAWRRAHDALDAVDLHVLLSLYVRIDAILITLLRQ